ncbi:MAG: hypothetical protein ACRCWQ_11615 [Bacilli bacterium]
MSKTKAFVTGLVLGSAAAGTYLFLRTDKGKQVMSDLNTQASRLGETWKDLTEDSDLLKDAVSKLKDESMRTFETIALGKSSSLTEEENTEVKSENIAADLEVELKKINEGLDALEDQREEEK